jgi:predicted nucleic acid-binding protein
VIPLGIELADRTARLRGETRLKLADAMIGASALSVGAELLVSEDPDLKRLRGHLKVEDIRRALKVLKSS